jgi:hypothetical protein
MTHDSSDDVRGLPGALGCGDEPAAEAVEVDQRAPLALPGLVHPHTTAVVLKSLPNAVRTGAVLTGLCQLFQEKFAWSPSGLSPFDQLGKIGMDRNVADASSSLGSPDAEGAVQHVLNL